MQGDHLWPLLTFDGLEGDALINAYRQTYIETYVRSANGNFHNHTDWTGAPVKFPPWQFDHAFTATDRFREGMDHDQFSLSRLQRLLWIKEVLAGNAGTIRRYAQVRKDSRGKPVKRRTFIVCEEHYVVVLNDPAAPGRPLQFVTAHVVVNQDLLKRNIDRGGLLEVRENSRKETAT